MMPTKPNRECWAAIVSLLIGTLVAASFKCFLLAPKPTLNAVTRLKVSSAVRVLASRSPTKSTLATPAAPQVRKLLINTATPVSKDSKVLVREDVPVVTLVQPLTAPVLSEHSMDRPTLQYADVPPQTLLKPIVEDLPPMPSDTYVPPVPEYAEQPGGEVLVLGLLVNSEGQVLDTRILVPSYNGLGDLSYAMIARKEKLTDIQPAIPPGEQRWLEIRVSFPRTQPILP